MPKPPERALTHDLIWTALDRLAERHGLSASGLAKRAGLDPTTFNRSKRRTTDGHERWPSTESLARALAATSSSIDSFVQLIGDGAPTLQAVPLVGFAQAAADGTFDDAGFPVGQGWNEMALPSLHDEHAFALEISGDQMKPAFRDGDVIVVSPATPIRRGDRVVVRTRDGELMVREMKRRTAQNAGAAGAQPRRRRPHARRRRCRLDRADRVGEPVAMSSGNVLVAAGLVPAIHVLSVRKMKRRCPAQGGHGRKNYCADRASAPSIIATAFDRP